MGGIINKGGFNLKGNKETEATSCYKTMDKWGLKDPRSLVKRAKIWKQEMSYEKAYDLWRVYNEKLLEQYNKKPFFILRYDINVDLYNSKVKQICCQMGLRDDNTMSFREEALHNNKGEGHNIPETCQNIWETLENVAL